MSTRINGPELAAEAMRRLALADRAERSARSKDFEKHLWMCVDGRYLSAGESAEYAVHMRETAAVYAQLADIASRLHPHSPQADEWRAAFSAAPVPSEVTA